MVFYRLPPHKKELGVKTTLQGLSQFEDTRSREPDADAVF